MSILNLWFRSKLNKIKKHFDPVEKQLRELSRNKRYTEGSFQYKDKKLTFPDTASFAFTYRELFQSEIYKFESPNKTPVIIDCGANIGLSVLYFKELFPKAKILAFEPERNICRYLRANILSLELNDVNVIEKAVWSNNGKLTFNNEGSDGNRIAELESKTSFNNAYDVETVKLSDYINEEVEFLKLDIEGAEVEVMKEVEPKLHFVKRIFIEYHSFEKTKQELDIILSILTRNHFRYYIETPNKMRELPFIDKQSFLGFDSFINIYADNLKDK